MTSQPTAKAPLTATFVTTAVIVRMFMTGAAVISFSHIVATSHALGLGWEAWTVPLLVDGLAILGMIGRSAKFAPATQRAGLRLMIGAGLLSLACNVYAGHNLGQRLYGVLVVAGFVVSEWYAGKLRPAAAAKPAVDPARSEAAKRAAATRKANTARSATPAQKAAATRKANRIAAELASMAGGYVPADAPVSPAPMAT